MNKHKYNLQTQSHHNFKIKQHTKPLTIINKTKTNKQTQTNTHQTQTPNNKTKETPATCIHMNNNNTNMYLNNYKSRDVMRTNANKPTRVYGYES